VLIKAGTSRLFRHPVPNRFQRYGTHVQSDHGQVDESPLP
jgi:hypothetical protein